MVTITRWVKFNVELCGEIIHFASGKNDNCCSVADVKAFCILMGKTASVIWLFV